MKKLPDNVARLLLKIIYLLSVVFCFIFRPAFRAVLIAVWSKNKILIVKNSYYHKFVVPGGYVHRGEHPATAAAREIKEEVGITADASRLKNRGEIKGTFRYKRETIHCFELILHEPFRISLDNREVTWFDFMPLEKALRLPLSRPVKMFLKQY
jgi:8-oxo-dGTP pyrophosphatase MutT (NUDIX family)